MRNLDVKILELYSRRLVTVRQSLILGLMDLSLNLDAARSLATRYESSSLLEARSFHPGFAGSMSVTQNIQSPGN